MEDENKEIETVDTNALENEAEKSEASEVSQDFSSEILEIVKGLQDSMTTILRSLDQQQQDDVSRETNDETVDETPIENDESETDEKELEKMLFD